MNMDFPVGTIVGFQGLKGTLKIRPNTNNPNLLLDLETITIRDESNGTNIEAKVSELWLEKRILFVNLEGFKDRTSVENLKGAAIFTSRSQLRELQEEEWWVDDLIGLRVFTTNGAEVGVISSIMDAGHQLLEIKLSRNNEERRLVPFVKALVPRVDMVAGLIEIEDIPGLLD